jgi:hypothetical protein
VSRYKQIIQIGLAAVVMMLAAHGPARAETVTVSSERPQVTRVQARSVTASSFFRRFTLQLKRLTRYAMAAN